jgi:hypothetical protein
LERISSEGLRQLGQKSLDKTVAIIADIKVVKKDGIKESLFHHLDPLLALTNGTADILDACVIFLAA